MFSILSISPMDAVDAVVGESAVAVGYQLYYFKGRPVGELKLCVCTFIVVHCNTNYMRGLAFVHGKKRNTNSYPLSRSLELKYNPIAMKWLTPMYLKRSWLHEGVNKWTG